MLSRKKQDICSLLSSRFKQHDINILQIKSKIKWSLTIYLLLQRWGKFINKREDVPCCERKAIQKYVIESQKM